jgi:long-subunit fatty acid transport protein
MLMVAASVWGDIVFYVGNPLDPANPIPITIPHLNPSGSLVTPPPQTAPPFKPPTFFSAPLPSGSGARALGLSAFTAVADDATAASWNPGGLTQLERPEGSFVFRGSSVVNTHLSTNPNYETDTDRFGTDGNLNYCSGVLPFQLARRNLVFSINYQEAYDFSQRFVARQSDLINSTQRETAEASYHNSETTYQRILPPGGGYVDLWVTNDVTTRKTSTMDQALASDMLSSLDFEQTGVIDSISPALAVELVPKLSLGMTANFYQNSLMPGHAIKSHNRIGYHGDSTSSVTTENRLDTTAISTWSIKFKPPLWPFPPLGPIPGTDVNTSSDSSVTHSDTLIEYDGLYDEQNEYDSLHGFNATLGGLWTVSRHLSLGACVDLPWTASAEQTKTVANTVTTYSQGRSNVLDVTESRTVETKDVDFHFPLFWSLGAVWRWNNVCFSTLDISQTRWSQFYFQAAGDERINPLDGSPYGQNKVDDCWTSRYGMEYLLVLEKTEIPLRGGLTYEQRPAVGKPDEYWGYSLGTGISIGQDPGKLIIDVAYSYLYGDNVLSGLVSGQTGLKTDVTRHEWYVSAIWHF